MFATFETVLPLPTLKTGKTKTKTFSRSHGLVLPAVTHIASAARLVFIIRLFNLVPTALFRHSGTGTFPVPSLIEGKEPWERDCSLLIRPYRNTLNVFASWPTPVLLAWQWYTDDQNYENNPRIQKAAADNNPPGARWFKALVN